MEEPRRFLRLVIPGLVFLTELVLFLWLSERTWNWARHTFQFSPDSIEKVLGATVTAFFASGAIGYVLASVNHAIFTPLLFRYDWVLKRLIEKNIPVQDLAGKPFQPVWWHLTQNWTVITALWHCRREPSLRIKGATPRAESLADLCHGAGAAFVGSLVAAVIVICVQAFADESGGLLGWIFWVSAPLLVCVHLLAFWRVALITRNYVGTVLIEELVTSRETALAAVRKRAFDICEKRGARAGTDLQDWAQAEAELPEEAAKLKIVVSINNYYYWM